MFFFACSLETPFHVPKSLLYYDVSISKHFIPFHFCLYELTQGLAETPIPMTESLRKLK